MLVDNIFDFYAWDTDDGRAAMVLGNGMIYNHVPSESQMLHATVEIDSSSPTDRQRCTGMIEYNVVALRNIVEGEEIFLNDGDNWFSDRKLLFNYNPSWERMIPTAGELPFPGCSSGLTEIVDGKVYLSQTVEEGDVIEVVRALLAPVPFASSPEYVRYLWFHEHSDTSMLLLGNAALYTAANITNGEEYNVRYEWFSPDGESAYWDDLVDHEIAFVALIADRLIFVNEELTVPLMVDPISGRRRVYNRVLPDIDTDFRDMREIDEEEEDDQQQVGEPAAVESFNTAANHNRVCDNGAQVEADQCSH
jgi:hypothetical protein